MHARTKQPKRQAALPEAAASSGRLESWGALGLVLLTIAAYLPALQAGFIWDDDVWVFGNRVIKASNGLWDIWFSTRLPDYFPLTSTSFWLEWRVWGAHATGYHITNLLLHALAVVLLWRVLRRLHLPAAWLAALVFAVHPVNVESVAWITERKNTLSLVFFLVSLLWYLRFEEGSKVQGPESKVEADLRGARGEARGPRLYYALSLLSFFLAILAKTSVVMLPLVLLLCLWWQRGQSLAASAHATCNTQPTTRITFHDFLLTLPFFALSLLFGLVTVWFQYHRAIGTDVVRTSGLEERLAGAGWAVWFYLSKALVPSELMIIYPRWQIDAHAVVSWLPAVALVACLGLGWWFRRGWGRPFLFALGYFVLMLLPVLGFLNISFFKLSLVADRWQYSAIIGIIALVVGLLWAGATGVRGQRSEGRNQGTEAGKHATRNTHHATRLLVSLMIVLVLIVLTWRRSGVYTNSETLWQDTLAKNPRCWVAELNWGAALLDRGSLDEAAAHFARALEIEPGHEEIHNSLGQLWEARGNPQEAIREYTAALAVNPNFPPAHYHLGSVLERQGKIDEAAQHFLAALRLAPDYDEPLRQLAFLLVRGGKPQEAIGHLTTALAINPNLPAAHYQLGSILESQGRLDEAREHFLTALRLAPDSAEPHNGLALVLIARGKPQEAVTQFSEAVRLNPSYLSAQNNLGRLLLGLGKIDEAWVHCNAAVRIAPDSAEAHFNLGNVLLAQQKIPQATAEYETVLRLAPDFSEARNQLGFISSMQGKTADAVASFRQTLKLDPHDVNALNTLAWILATHREAAFRNGVEAVQLAEQAVQQTRGADARSLDTLAAAYAETGRFADAVKREEEALEQVQSAGRNNLVAPVSARLQLYKGQRPFRE